MSAACLECPECGADAIPSKASGCRGCEEGAEHDDDHRVEPMWTEDDGGECPECHLTLRVVVDDGHAYAEVSDAAA